MVSFKVFKGTKEGIREATTEKQIGDDEVLVRVTHSGLCHTDNVYRHADMVLGHEGIGIIEEIGKRVTQHKKGDRVGWGYQHDSCGKCKQCLERAEIYCHERKIYGEANPDQGSFATHGVWKETFVFPIPDALRSEDAAPLMCGGATVFAALHNYPAIRPGSRVGVVGIGGLGHLAIQFAAKMGHEVVVFSGTDSKREEATRLGASKFYATRGVKSLDMKRLDVLLITSAALPDWKLFMPVIEHRSIIFPLTFSGEDMVYPSVPFIGGGITFQGSLTATRQTQKDMLHFAALHAIRPILQEYPMTTEGIEEAFRVLEEGNMRYRGLLVVQ